MLSEQEREWLERRKKNEKEYGSVYCPYCTQFIAERDEYIGHCYDDLYCPLTDHFIPDVAEFEARVAENLCKIDGRCLWTTCKDNMQGCTFCRLYYARIAAEKEMDGGHK